MRILDAPRYTHGFGMLQGRAGELIEQLGRPAFPGTLFGLARSAIGADHVTAFLFTPGGQPSLVLAENAGAQAIARRTGGRYVERYWRMDPLTKLGQCCPSGPFLVDMTASDIAEASYRSDCYLAVRLGARLSLCERRGGTMLRLSFYRERLFGEAEAEAVLGSAALLMPMLWREAQPEQTRCGRDGREIFAARLARRVPQLPRRERDICALIAAGFGSEGIALELGISRNTVLTYRKRAYAGCGSAARTS